MLHKRTPHSPTSNQYPEKRYRSRIMRALASIGPLLGIISSPARPQGISIIMRVKDEIDWIRPSVHSIKSISDEIIVVDNGSTDGTYDILREMADHDKNLIKLWRQPDLDICSLSNFALEKTTFRWVFKWDGDTVARTTGGNSIHHLRERVLTLDPRRYYLIYLKKINLAGDLFHQDPKEMVHIEEYIHNFSDRARYIHPGRFEAVKFPKYYKPLFWYEPYAFHVDVKPARRMLLRFFWEEWMELKDYLRFPRIESYVEEKMKEVFGTESWEQAQKLCVERICRHFIPYDPELFGPYPESLKPHLKRPKYRLIYKNNQIVGRDEG